MDPSVSFVSQMMNEFGSLCEFSDLGGSQNSPDTLALEVAFILSQLELLLGI